MAWIECCKRCKRPFAVTACGKFPMADWEDIVCPYCNHSYERRASTTFSSSALTPEQEAAYAKGDLKSD